ncbi:MAG TPA: hypothetical protein VNL17_14750 [Verrucomicrobiae bacterium]|nr:hypothetical protein [Verrucomicrobiae bacterium]
MSEKLSDRSVEALGEIVGALNEYADQVEALEQKLAERDALIERMVDSLRNVLADCALYKPEIWTARMDDATALLREMDCVPLAATEQAAPEGALTEGGAR